MNVFNDTGSWPRMGLSEPPSTNCGPFPLPPPQVQRRVQGLTDNLNPSLRLSAWETEGWWSAQGEGKQRHSAVGPARLD